MSRSYWLPIIALGLVVANGALAKEVAGKNPIEDKATQEKSSEQLAINSSNTSVQAIAPTKPTNSKHNKRYQGDGDSRGDDGLLWGDGVAQWIMAVFSIAATGVSVWAIIIVRDTLRANTDAVAVARESVRVTKEMGQAQVRAYLFVGWEMVVREYLSSIPEIEIWISNHGNTPAVLKRFHYEWAYVEPCSDIPKYLNEFTSIKDNTIGGGRGYKFDNTNAHPSRPYLFGFVEYEDVFRVTRVTRFCIKVTVKSPTDIKSEPAGPPAYNEWN